MANRYDEQYPGNWGAGTPDYPQGVPQNKAPGQNNGSYWDANTLKDIMGFLQGLLLQAGITPNNSPDTAQASQYVDAVRQLSQGTDINATLEWDGSAWQVAPGSTGVDSVVDYQNVGDAGRIAFYIKLSVSLDLGGMFVSFAGISQSLSNTIRTDEYNGEPVLSIAAPLESSLTAGKSKVNIMRFTKPQAS